MYLETYQVRQKRLLCRSILNNGPCKYGAKCTYAHSYTEQIIDADKLELYQTILDKNLLNIQENPEKCKIYASLLKMGTVCPNCINNKCTGGYNCRDGSFDKMLKLCKNDLYTGACTNKLVSIHVSDDIRTKFGCDMTFEYIGCYNGHHLTSRGLMSYCKYQHDSKEIYHKFIDHNHIENIKSGNYNISYDNNMEYALFPAENIDLDDLVSIQ